MTRSYVEDKNQINVVEAQRDLLGVHKTQGVLELLGVLDPRRQWKWLEDFSGHYQKAACTVRKFKSIDVGSQRNIRFKSWK